MIKGKERWLFCSQNISVLVDVKAGWTIGDRLPARTGILQNATASVAHTVSNPYLTLNKVQRRNPFVPKTTHVSNRQ
jgi:hypothetical protein